MCFCDYVAQMLSIFLGRCFRKGHRLWYWLLWESRPSFVRLWYLGVEDCFWIVKMLRNENLANHAVKCTMQIMHHNTISLAQNRQFFFLSAIWLFSGLLWAIYICWRDSLTLPMLITMFYLFWPNSYRKPYSDVESQSPVKSLVLELETFLIRLQFLNAHGHSPFIMKA